MARRIKPAKVISVKTSERAKRKEKRSAEKDSGEVEEIFERLIGALEELTSSIDDLSEDMLSLADKVESLDAHNSHLHEAMRTLSSRFDLISGIGSAVKSLVKR